MVQNLDPGISRLCSGNGAFGKRLQEYNKKTAAFGPEISNAYGDLERKPEDQHGWCARGGADIVDPNISGVQSLGASHAPARSSLPGRVVHNCVGKPKNNIPTLTFGSCQSKEGHTCSTKGMSYGSYT